jgi:type II secretory pathway predicted ATPase ExeA
LVNLVFLRLLIVYRRLSDEEIPLYLKHKLEFAGGNTLILDDDALRCLCTASCGISRTIDHIMTDALAYGAQTGRNRIDAEIMQVAIDNQSLVLRKRFSTKASSNRARIA